MKPVYQRASLIITEFEKEDMITTSGISPISPTGSTDSTDPTSKPEIENIHQTYSHFGFAPRSWFDF